MAAFATGESLASVFRDGLFRDDVFFITGGGSGIGLAIAKEAAALGAKAVVCAGRSASKLASAVAEVNAIRECAFPMVLNIRDNDAVVAAVGEAVRLHGPITCLVNNAGGQFPSPAESISPKGWHAVIDTNLNGTFWVTSAVFEAFCRARETGMTSRTLRVVCITAESLGGMPMMSHSGAARAGVENLVKTLAIEWASRGVRLNAVAPGIIFSSGMASYPPQVQRQLPELAAGNPAARAGTESEVSSAVLFLLSPGASYVNGCTLRVDGAASLRKLLEFGRFGPDIGTPAFHLSSELRARYDAVLQRAAGLSSRL